MSAQSSQAPQQVQQVLKMQTPLEQWHGTSDELKVLKKRFVEIHDLSREEVAAHEAELKAMRKRCAVLAGERYRLVDQLRGTHVPWQ